MTMTREQWCFLGAAAWLVLLPGPLPLIGVAVSGYLSRFHWGVSVSERVRRFWFDGAIWIPSLLVGAMLFAKAPMPRDDMLAIVPIALGDFSHLSFIGSQWGLFGSPWIGLEWLVAQLITVLADKDLAIRTLQSFAVVGTMGLATLAVRKEMPSSKQFWLFALVLVALMLRCGLPMRAVGARAEAFFALLVLLAFVARPWVWLVVGVAMAPLYWLAPIYAPAALLLKATLRVRLISALAYVGFSAAIWLVFTDGHWLEWLAQTQQWVGNRIGGAASVTENAPVFQALGWPAVLLLCGLFALLATRGAVRREDWPFAVVIGWFLLPDMIRYVPLVMVVLGVWVARLSERQPLQLSRHRAASLIIAPLGVWYLLHGANLGEESAPLFQIPPASAVFAEPAPSYLHLAYSSQGIRLAPSFEPGADVRELQDAALNIGSNGSISCDLLQRFSFDYLAEKSLRSLPSCLSLVQVSGHWRLWRIDKGAQQP